MRITFDPTLNVGYVYLREGEAEVTTLSLSEDVHIDMLADGSIYGIELLDARKQLFGNNGNMLEIVNEQSEQRVEVALPR